MKVMAILGSPRSESNTERLADKVIEGCASKTAVKVEKIHVTKQTIDYCTGCMTCCYPPPGTGRCVIKDDMAPILESMKTCDAFIFATPNHMGTITAPMLNFLSRMMPLFDFKLELDDAGNITGGELSSKIIGKKAAFVISQGDPFFSSSLVYMVLDKNMNDFKLVRIGDVISRANLALGAVKEKEHDLSKAFDLGVQLATASGIAP